MVAFTKGQHDECYVLMNKDGKLVWDYNQYTKDEVYSDDFAYVPPFGKTKDEVYVGNMEPLCEIGYAYKKSLIHFKNQAELLIETEHSLLLRVGDAHYRYDKEDIDYEKTYEQENLEYIDEL